MTRYDDPSWRDLALKRRAYRDFARDKFFKDVGLKEGSTTYAQEGAPQAQQQTLHALLTLTCKGDLVDGNQTELIEDVMDALRTLDFGNGEMGSLASTVTPLRDHSMKSLRENWFWSPAFFD